MYTFLRKIQNAHENESRPKKMATRRQNIENFAEAGFFELSAMEVHSPEPDALLIQEKRVAKWHGGKISRIF